MTYEVKYGEKPPRVAKPGRMTPAKGSRPGVTEAKRRCLLAIQQGRTVREAMAEVGRSEKTYEYWKKTDEKWYRELRLLRDIRSASKDANRERVVSSFEDFRREYLLTETFPHQSRWIDILEGREPRDLHPNMVYEPGDPNYILITTPPEHAKSSTITMDWITYRLCKDPNERVIIVSATQALASKMVYGIQQRLTHPRYSKLQIAFAPAEGFNGPNSTWRQDMVYFDSEARDGIEKDPNIQALGFGGQIYGSRASIIVCDDVTTLKEAHTHDKQRSWLNQEAITRLGPGGRLIIAGTRVAAVDLYSELRNPDNYTDGESPWTYLSQPAVLEYADDPKDWVTLWPHSDRPWGGIDPVQLANGYYPRWDGEHLAKRRRLMGDERIWGLVYQQQDVGEDAIFPAKEVRACVNGRRNHGLMDGDNQYHERPEGMNGLYTVCSMDPAMAGETAAITMAVDIKTGKRFVLDATRLRAPTPQQMRQVIYDWTDKYKPQCWVIEKNAFQLFLTRDEEIRIYLANRGCSMQEHYTSNNKIDPDFGVASLAPLFSNRLISLPSAHNCEGVKALVEQLIIWRPGVKGSKLIQDLPMALWFAELKVREAMDQALGKSASHYTSKYTPRYRQAKQQFALVGDPSWN